MSRDGVFVEAKIWISDYGYDNPRRGLDKSAGKLGVEQLDLLILHQALPSNFEGTLGAYRALETLLERLGGPGGVAAVQSGYRGRASDAGLTSPLERLTVVLDDFELATFQVSTDVQLRFRVGGEGPAVVLLHGHPRTHTTWWQVAPRLVDAGLTVICPDLRGYGRSTAPEPRPDHAQASKRAMAQDVVALMDHLRVERYAVVGHDRGSYVAFRLAMDHPERVTRLAVLDSVPIGEALARVDAGFAAAWWHWFFFAQPELPERTILADPDAWYRTGEELAMGSENHADFVQAVRNPDVVRSMLEDYRAGLTVDRAHDDADRDGARHLHCPTLVAWSTRDDMEQLYGDPLKVWQPWAPDLRGAAIDSGHHMAEENPTELAAVLIAHLSALR